MTEMTLQEKDCATSTIIKKVEFVWNLPGNFLFVDLINAILHVHILSSIDI